MSKNVNDTNEVSLAAQVNRDQIEHRATWMALIYDEMVKAGIKDAEKIVRRAIARNGEIDGKKLKAKCKNPEDCQEFQKVFLSDIGIETFKMDNFKSDKDNFTLSFNYCPLLSAWKKLGFDDERCLLLCDFAMEGDRNIAKTMGYKLSLTDRIAGGCSTCKIGFHK